MSKFKFVYDDENDMMFISNGKNDYRYSEPIGFLVFDLNSKKEIVGIQVFNPSSNFDISKEKLRSLSEVSFKIKENRDVLFNFKFKSNKIEEKLVHVDPYEFIEENAIKA